MAGYLPATSIKRKELEEAHDELSDFSLLHLPRKMRRLDAGLAPAMYEGAAPLVFEPQSFMDQMNGSPQEAEVLMTEAVPVARLDEERALALYQPMGMPSTLPSGLSNVSFRVDADFIANLKRNPNPASMELLPRGNRFAQFDNCLALVPWVPPQTPQITCGGEDDGAGSRHLFEAMEAEEAGDASMEIEDEQEPAVSYEKVGDHQQWQQHCMTPNLPPNASAPIMWSQ